MNGLGILANKIAPLNLCRNIADQYDKNLLENKHHIIINEHFSVNCSAPTYIEIISKLSKKPEWSGIKQFFKTSAEPTEVVGEISWGQPVDGLE